MASNKKLLVLPGDGIGPEVRREVFRVVDWMDRRRAVTFDVTEDMVGGCAIDKQVGRSRFLDQARTRPVATA